MPSYASPTSLRKPVQDYGKHSVLGITLSVIPRLPNAWAGQAIQQFPYDPYVIPGLCGKLCEITSIMVPACCMVPVYSLP